MTSLWRGKDHLVYVRGKGFLIPHSEEYKRYRFEDIQALSISQKSRFTASILYGLGLFVCAIPLVLILAFSTEENFGMGQAVAVSIFAVGTLCFLGLLLRHLILGPTCVCDLQTSLSQDRLLPLRRFHSARQCLDSLAKDIRLAQEPLSSAASDQVEEIGSAPPVASEGFSVPVSVLPTFIGFIVLGVGALAGLHLESVVLTILLLIILLLVSFSLTFSQIASVRNLTPEPIRTLLWITMGLLFLFTGTATVHLLIAAARDPIYTLDFRGPLEALTGVASVGGVGFYLVFLAISLGFFAVGLLGVWTTQRWKALIESTEKPETGEEPSPKDSSD